MVTIFTGKINSGKTRALRIHFEAERKGDGFFCIKRVEDEIHVGYDLLLIAENTTVPFIRKKDCARSESSFTIGDWALLTDGFETAEAKLECCIAQGIEPVYIDELGILETRGQCFFNKAKEVLQNKLALVTAVRESCLKEIIAVLEIDAYIIKQV